MGPYRICLIHLARMASRCIHVVTSAKLSFFYDQIFYHGMDTVKQPSGLLQIRLPEHGVHVSPLATVFVFSENLQSESLAMISLFCNILFLSCLSWWPDPFTSPPLCTWAAHSPHRLSTCYSSFETSHS